MSKTPILGPTGKPLIVNSLPSIADDACDCCGEPTSECPNCSGGAYAGDLTLTLSGLSDGGSCPQCTNLNGTWILPHVPNCLYGDNWDIMWCGVFGGYFVELPDRS